MDERSDKSTLRPEDSGRSRCCQPQILKSILQGSKRCLKTVSPMMTVTTNPSELDNCLLVISHTHTYPDSPRIHVSSVLSSVNRSSDAPEDVLFCPPGWLPCPEKSMTSPAAARGGSRSRLHSAHLFSEVPFSAGSGPPASEVCLPRVRVLGCVSRIAPGC